MHACHTYVWFAGQVLGNWPQGTNSPHHANFYLFFVFVRLQTDSYLQPIGIIERKIKKVINLLLTELSQLTLLQLLMGW